jgi:MFS family permease
MDMPRSGSLPAAFASLRIRNYRIFASGQLVSNTGAWVQRIGQDWLVLTITNSAADVGITAGLQFLPTLLFGLLGGAIADRHNKRLVLIVTNLSMASMAGLLAVLTVSKIVEPWHIYLIASGLGVVTAVDNPTRQSYVNELVGPGQLRNAISLNASIFQLGALIGPPISGYLIHTVGVGGSFSVNCISYVGPVVTLWRIDTPARRDFVAKVDDGARIVDAVRFAWGQPTVLWTCVIIGVFGFFSINLPVTLAAYAKTVFHSGPTGYGLLSSAVALGSLSGAFISAHGRRTEFRRILLIGAVACVAIAVASGTQSEWALIAMLVPVGAATLVLLTSANSMVQLTATDDIRGRIMGIYLCVFVGSGAFGGPILGTIDEHLGPSAGLLMAGLVPGAAILLVAIRFARRSDLWSQAVRSWQAGVTHKRRLPLDGS